MQFQYPIEGGNFTKAGSASSEIKKILKKINVPARIVKRTVVALYEAEVNIVAHARKGTIEVEIDPEKIRIVVQDEGPGIPDLNMAMREGYSTASEKVREMGFGAGMGLPNIKKNINELDIQTEIDKGTRLTMINYFK